MRKKIGLIILIISLILMLILITTDSKEIKSVKSDRQLLNIYKQNESYDYGVWVDILGFPFSPWFGYRPYKYRYYDYEIVEDAKAANSTISTGTKDYSTTNIQVANVDEADITKTDGDYIYSLSDDKVIITNVINPNNIKIESTISANDDSIPEDLILYKDKLIVISYKERDETLMSYQSNTVVKIYDISNKAKPKVIKSYELYQPYYTSRCIDNELYVISSGYLIEDDNKIVRSYKEDNKTKEIPLSDIKYLKDIKTNNQTIILNVDLNNIGKDIHISSYLIDISNAYVSENNIYLLDSSYDGYNDGPTIGSLFGLKGIFGAFDYDYDYDTKTKIYRFGISKEGNISYKAKAVVDGSAINQYSADEQNNHFRIATYGSKGAKITIFDENLKEIGSTDYVAKGQKMYSSRFIGNKAYLVTYKTVDPLYVIDLQDETNPVVLGELHIPGYSTYLHPYDDTHLIGIGMETKEETSRDSSGKVISTWSVITGMKMALFDVSDVNNPVQLSQTIIGDSRTTSAILNNPKALLFSKEKHIIAIPVNNYQEDFSIADYDETYDSMVDLYRQYQKSYIAEGYFVYDISIDDGFNLKGVITHKNDKSYYTYYNNTRMLRGLYIDDNLYTISSSAIKVNNLKDLKLIDEINIKEVED